MLAFVCLSLARGGWRWGSEVELREGKEGGVTYLFRLFIPCVKHELAQRAVLVLGRSLARRVSLSIFSVDTC